MSKQRKELEDRLKSILAEKIIPRALFLMELFEIKQLEFRGSKESFHSDGNLYRPNNDGWRKHNTLSINLNEFRTVSRGDGVWHGSDEKYKAIELSRLQSITKELLDHIDRMQSKYDEIERLFERADKINIMFNRDLILEKVIKKKEKKKEVFINGVSGLTMYHEVREVPFDETPFEF